MPSGLSNSRLIEAPATPHPTQFIAGLSDCSGPREPIASRALNATRNWINDPNRSRIRPVNPKG